MLVTAIAADVPADSPVGGAPVPGLAGGAPRRSRGRRPHAPAPGHAVPGRRASGRPPGRPAPGGPAPGRLVRVGLLLIGSAAVVVLTVPWGPVPALDAVQVPGVGALALVVLLAIYVVAVEQRSSALERGEFDRGPLDAVSRLPFSLDRCQDPEALGAVLARFLTALGYVDVSVEPLAPGQGADVTGYRGTVAIPLVHPHDGAAEGLATVRWPAGHPPHPVAEVAGRAASLAALALRRLHHEQDAERRASLDHLTGLPNRRALALALERELAAAGACGSALGLVVLDVDDFKAVNDRHGHAAGDRVLVELATGLRGAARGDDLVARVGGEEFVAVLPDVDPEALWEITERIRVSVMAAVTSRPVTVSAGVASFPVDGRDAACLFEAADLALYRAKRAGRDQTQTATRTRARPVAPDNGPVPAVSDDAGERGGGAAPRRTR